MVLPNIAKRSCFNLFVTKLAKIGSRVIVVDDAYLNNFYSKDYKDYKIVSYIMCLFNYNFKRNVLYFRAPFGRHRDGKINLSGVW